MMAATASTLDLDRESENFWTWGVRRQENTLTIREDLSREGRELLAGSEIKDLFDYLERLGFKRSPTPNLRLVESAEDSYDLLDASLGALEAKVKGTIPWEDIEKELGL
jgi:hypothetical protein